ncbi:hypothetical protein [Streptomyces armeniacus]|uniref:hypothetical protein n=1 Tax=Streptomyces armeniacus TaxID=83291 RepID=UPI001C9ADCF4|nr:hypothetical protein [Streptomyces armeniacus]
MRNDTAQALSEQGHRDEALAIWHELAEQGDARATANVVVECAADGRYTDALRWWRRLEALRTGVPPHEPGVRLRGLGKTEAAEGWWRTAAEKLKDDRSCEYLGISLRERGHGQEASRWLRQGAERGDGPCARELAGLAFERAERAADPVTREIHTEEAAKWTREAAAAGDSPARLILHELEEQLAEQLEEQRRAEREGGCRGMCSAGGTAAGGGGSATRWRARPTPSAADGASPGSTPRWTRT